MWEFEAEIVTKVEDDDDDDDDDDNNNNNNIVMLNILTVAVHLTLSSNLFYFTKYVLMSSEGYINWLLTYLTKRQSYVSIVDTFLQLLKFFRGHTRICFRTFTVFNIFIKEFFKVIKLS